MSQHTSQPSDIFMVAHAKSFTTAVDIYCGCFLKINMFETLIYILTIIVLGIMAWLFTLLIAICIYVPFMIYTAFKSIIKHLNTFKNSFKLI